MRAARRRETRPTGSQPSYRRIAVLGHASLPGNTPLGSLNIRWISGIFTLGRVIARLLELLEFCTHLCARRTLLSL
jgi:hypothetical protein